MDAAHTANYRYSQERIEISGEWSGASAILFIVDAILSGGVFMALFAPGRLLLALLLLFERLLGLGARAVAFVQSIIWRKWHHLHSVCQEPGILTSSTGQTCQHPCPLIDAEQASNVADN